MTYKTRIGIAMFSLFAALPVLAGEFDINKPMICALAEINECNSGEDCAKVTAEMINAPNFLKIDLRKKTMATIKTAGEDQEARIGQVEEIDGRMMLLGAVDGSKDEQDGSGYALSISKRTGNMIASVTAYDVAFVVFGACINE